MPEPPISLPPLVLAPHNNQQLFSDYYLNRKLPERDDWRALADEAAAVQNDVAALLAGYRASDNEAQVEHDLVRPVLTLLGHDFEVQPALKTPDGTKRPDYVFYRSAEARDANKSKTLTDALLRPGGLVVGDAKAWDRPLDSALQSKSKSSDPFTNKNPSYQIAFYVQHSGLDWGILTNGRKWRLYHRESAHKLTRFYEVDLPALIASGDTARFLYFWAFFRREAFEPGAPLGVGALLQESSDFARGVGNSLKKQVYDALHHLAQGFLDYPANGLDARPRNAQGHLRQFADFAVPAVVRVVRRGARVVAGANERAVSGHVQPSRDQAAGGRGSKSRAFFAADERDALAAAARIVRHH